MAAGDELVDIVDEHDRVVRVATRREVRAGRLLHRSVFVLVRAPSGSVLVHRRAPTKDVWPGRWDLAAGGVVASGEVPDDAACRELAEELGIVDVTPRRLGRGSYADADVAELATLYEVTWDGPVHFADGEVVEARWVAEEELGRMVAELPFVPDSVALVLPYVVRGDGATAAPRR
jgi:isopentenyldiphosphate isomerase